MGGFIWNLLFNPIQMGWKMKMDVRTFCALNGISHTDFIECNSSKKLTSDEWKAEYKAYIHARTIAKMAHVE